MSSRTIADTPGTDYTSREAELAREDRRDEPQLRGDRHVYERTHTLDEPANREYVKNQPLDSREHPYADRGTSWTSVILGWLTAMGAGLILAGIVSGIVGAMLGAGDTAHAAATESATAGLVGLLITLFLAFLIGGYCAGRMASRSGLKHGLLVPALALAVTIVLAVVGAVFGTSFIDSLGGVTLPSLPADVPQQSLGTIFTVAGILALIFPFIGGALGGMWGARTGRKRP